MTIDELREWIKDEIVLHEGDVAEWEWRKKGLTTEAKAIGLSDADFSRLVNQVSLSVQPDFGKISVVRDSILTLARQRRGKLTPADVETLVKQAEPARLSRAFVADKWIPALVQTLPVETEAVTPPPVVENAPIVEPATTPGETAESMRRKVTDSLDDFKGRIPAPAIRSLFRTINFDEAELAVAIWSYLQIHEYVPERELISDSLREKLVSTDWRVRQPEPELSPLPREQDLPPPPAPIVHTFTATPGRVRSGQDVRLEWDVANLLAVTVDDVGEGLSPQNWARVNPRKTTEYTLFDALNNPLSTVRVEVIPSDRSGLYGVLFALALLALIYFFIRNTNNTSQQRQTDPPARVEKRDVTEPAQPRKKQRRQETASVSTDEASDYRTQLPAPKKEIETDYDEILDDAGQFGERKARKGNRWGLWTDDGWLIRPKYDDITEFRNGRATVINNGNDYQIDPEGKRIRE
ncbi:WG repeat-containing protein [Spirosoma montaniterrae]|uniref:WG repeat-containing protein n=1 Tax=Spirosoma montaniterrae TaxID=1178516 RepID=A0A1P9WSG8_9BACT|nr:WG repeat-containing protein [Spirosoma montaniterrae]AQG78309.1 hypothetical protein AWR27_02505 [Spirosoma montaniterrae]